MQMGERIKEERERLGFNQTEFAALVDATRKTLFNWEGGAAAPNAAVLATWAAHGLDVLYVVTGERNTAMPAADASEQVLLESYRRCKPEARVHLIQTAALLSAGLEMPKTKSKTSQAAGNVQIGDIVSTHDGSVQIGYAGGKVRVSKK